MKVLLVCATTLVLVLAMTESTSGLGCHSDTGEPVDWWAAIKTPTESSSDDPNVEGGVAYAYLDSNSNDGEVLTLTGNSLATDKSGSLWSTLAGVYAGSSSPGSTGWVMFNDETPSGGKSGTKAHQKGVVGWTGDSGFWLVHSVPRFPNTVEDGYAGFPENEDKYGQSFLCLSLGLEELDLVGELLLMSRPNVYDSNLPSGYADSLGNLIAVINGVYNHSAGTIVKELQTQGGASFTAFSKNRAWDSDLYEDLVAPHLGDNILAETWMNGVNPLPTYCKPQYPYDVRNIRLMAVASPRGDDVIWKETQDHSKWAIAESKPYTCIGGINRQNGQRVRGGGTVCHSSQALWASFNATIRVADTCN